MKRFLVVCAAAMLCCSLVSAQEAEDTGRGAGLSIVPRLDAGILRNREESSTSFNFGNTSLYTFFEGNLSDKWSFSLSNHWIGSDFTADNFREGLLDATKSLYAFYTPFSGNSGNNFIDWAYVTYAPGSFAFTLGKMPMIVGGFEFDEYDVDVHPVGTSLFWNSFFVYQPALMASWTTPSELSTLTVQLSSDQYNTHPAYGLRWEGEYGPYSMNWSGVLVRTHPDWGDGPRYYPILSFGNRLTLGDFSLTADFINRCGDPTYTYGDLKGHTLIGTLAYNPSDSFNLSFRCVWNQARDSFFLLDEDEEGEPELIVFDKANFLTTVLTGYWYPVEDEETLRVQWCFGMQDKNPFATIGLTCKFDFKLW